MFLIPVYRELEHTADLRLEIWGFTWNGLLQHSAIALSDVITERRRIRPTAYCDFECRAERPDELVVALLRELLIRFETKDWLSHHIEILRADNNALQVRSWGEPYQPKRHPIKTELKAVTYHGLELIRRWWGWRARIVFDI